MNESHDQPMMDNVEEVEMRLPLSEDEHKILELWDKLQELRLEIAIINAQDSIQPDGNTDKTTGVSAAQNDLIEARARYLLRKRVIESVMTASPILKAVHNGRDATPVERDLLPEVQKRDEVSILVAKSASLTNELRNEATRAQAKTLRVSRKNVELAAEVMSLVAEVNAKKTGHQDNERLHQLQDDLKSSRQRWRVMKGVTSGVVTGSGVDWARDETLRDLVLDPENDDF